MCPARPGRRLEAPLARNGEARGRGACNSTATPSLASLHRLVLSDSPHLPGHTPIMRRRRPTLAGNIRRGLQAQKVGAEAMIMVVVMMMIWQEIAMRPMRRLAWLVEVRTLARWALATTILTQRLPCNGDSTVNWSVQRMAVSLQHASSGGESFLHK